MTHHAWQCPVIPAEAARRAGGRRRINWLRGVQQQLRRQQVVRLLREGRSQAEIAQALHVHPATISKDVAALRAQRMQGRSYQP
jgi:DNA-binding NarL/FixJ family response regulator